MTSELRAIVLSEARTMSYGLIAKRNGITRNQVAGVVWRATNPPASRKIRRGRHGCGCYAQKTLRGHNP